MNNNTAIKVEAVSKTFKLPHERSGSVKNVLVNVGRRKRGYEIQSVLSDISFEVKKGEFFGIVGRNGSGKSTLLKMLAGIYTPTSGSITVNGKLTPFIELGVGFSPELTGRENVFLNGALLGFDRKEMEAMYDEIVEFAELERFMDQKLKNYSSGMQVRLAFSIAIRANTDILVLDEVLAVGDEAFQRKCDAFFERIKKDNTKTIILVTHSMASVKKYCSKAILIDQGKITAQGNPRMVADKYSLESLEAAPDKEEGDNKEVAQLSAKITSSKVLKSKDTLRLTVTYRNSNDKPVYIKVVAQVNNTAIMVANSKITHSITTSDTKSHTVEYELPLKSFNYCEVGMVVLLVDQETDVALASYGYSKELTFKIVRDDSRIGGVINNDGMIKLIK